MKKVLWGAAYVGAFVVAVLVGAVVPSSLTPSGLAFGNVDWDESVGTVHEDLEYGDGAFNRYDLYVPADDARDTYGMVVYLHAGGFTSGDKADDASIAHYFTSLGYVTATINYSLNSEEAPADLNLMRSEIRAGVDAAAAESARLGYELDGMVVGGGSAGGALAMLYGYGDAETAPVPVNAVINLVGPASFEPSAWFGLDPSYADDDEAAAAAGFVSTMTGEEVSVEMMRDGSYEQVLQPVTPLALIGEDAPPTLAAFGVLDKVAPYAASEDLADVLEANGVPHDVILFPNSGHALNRDGEQAAQLADEIAAYLDEYLPVR